MRDGLLRRAVKRVARVIYETDLRLTRGLRRARGKPVLELGGTCQRCAKCCEAPSIQASRVVFHWRVARRLFLAWQRHVNGFELTGTEPRQRVFVFRCTHFDAETRRCDSYDSRPGMCRDYPRNLLDHPVPQFLPGCGYRAVNTRAARLEELLQAEELPAEKRARIVEVFHLREGGGGAGRGTGAPEAGRNGESGKREG
jgi:Fe-S-cluster containining protein